MDIGANDVDGCLGSSGINTSCVQTGLAQITSSLPQILNGLSAADPGVAVYGMDYYDPFLSQWLSGASGQSIAEQSETYATGLNLLLGQIYGAANVSMADPASLFETADFALTGSYEGTAVPQNVALICEWTLMCSENNIHPNDAGHAEVAKAFKHVVDHVKIATSSLASGLVEQSYSSQLVAIGGHPPYKWTVVAGRGNLPPGLLLQRSTGIISGTPTATGTYVFAVRIADTKVKVIPTTQNTATAEMSISVG